MSIDRLLPAAIVVAATTALVVLGPAATHIIRYRVSANAVTQLVGCEVITLAAALVVAWASVWGHTTRWHLIGAGAAAYIVYQMLTLVVGQDYSRYDGNGEHFFALYVLVTLGALWCLANLLSPVLRGSLAPSPSPGTAARITLVVVALAFAVLWIMGILGERHGHTADYLADPTLFWLIKYLDLGVVVPSSIVCATLWSETHREAGLVVLAFSFWMMLAIAGMQVSVVTNHIVGAGALPIAFIMLTGGVWCGWMVLAATRTSRSVHGPSRAGG